MKARKAVAGFICVAATPMAAACGGTGSGTTPSSPGVVHTPGGVNAAPVASAVKALERAVRYRDVHAMCGLLLPATAVHAHGSQRAIKAALAAQKRDCESGFGRHGEFNGYAPLVDAKVSRIRVRGDLASVQVTTNRGPGSLRFLYLAGQWRLLLAGS